MGPNIEWFVRFERVSYDVFRSYREIYEEKKKYTIQTKHTMSVKIMRNKYLENLTITGYIEEKRDVLGRAYVDWEWQVLVKANMAKSYEG